MRIVRFSMREIILTRRNYIKKKLSPHGFLLPRGKFTGIRITRVPVKYLLYMVGSMPDLKEVAELELVRRNCLMPKIDVSSHAIDQASLRLNKQWHSLSRKDEGLFSWLLRMGEKALSSGTHVGGDRVAYKKMIFIFDIEPELPILKTVMLNPKSNTRGYR